MEKTCCPQYTIRCDVTKIKLSKSQKKVLKNVNKFLISGARSVDVPPLAETCGSGSSAGVVTREPVAALSETNLTSVSSAVGNDEQVSSEANSCVSSVVDEKVEETSTTCDIEELEGSEGCTSAGNTKEAVATNNKSVAGADPTKPPRRKAKDIRKEKRLLKMSTASTTTTTTTGKVPKSGEKSIEDFIDDLPSDTKHSLTLHLISVDDKRLFEATVDEEFELYRKYQHVIHNDKEVHTVMDKTIFRFLTNFLSNANFLPPVFDLPTNGHVISVTFYATGEKGGGAPGSKTKILPFCYML